MASCPQVQTGHHFLADTLAHIDCQAQAIGSYGYGALADPGSMVSLALTGLLTIFIAIFGVRLLLGEAVAGRDVIGDVLKIGIVLTLATSWPAWRTLGYDVVMRGPSEVAGSIGLASGLPGGRGDLVARLQNADDSIVALTMYGTGRLTGGVVGSSDLGDSFRGIALADQSGLAYGRVAYLAGTIGPLALARLGAGILLALAPLMAGLLLFAGTRDLFFGWLRGLAAAAIAALVLALVHGAELGVLEPWLAGAMAQRGANIYTPSVPTELMVITLAFALVSFAMVALVARIAFFGGMGVPRISWRGGSERREMLAPPMSLPDQRLTGADHPRAHDVADAVAISMRREERQGDRLRIEQAGPMRGSMVPALAPVQPGHEALGSSYRRGQRRSSAAGERRDRIS